MTHKQNGSGRLGLDRRNVLKGIGIGTTALGMSGVTSAEGCDHIVGDTASTYDSIEKAVSDAAEGDTICIRPGKYQEDKIVIDKQIVLEGAGKNQVTIDSQSSGNGLVLTKNAGGTEVKGLGVKYAGNKGIDTVRGSPGTTVLSDVTFKDILVQNNADRGLVLDYTSNSTVKDVVAKGNGNDGVTLWQCEKCTVMDVTAIDNADNGVYVNKSGHTVKNVEVRENTDEGFEVDADDTTAKWVIARNNHNGGIKFDDADGNTELVGAETSDNALADVDRTAGLVLEETANIDKVEGNFEDGIEVGGMDVDPSN